MAARVGNRLVGDEHKLLGLRVRLRLLRLQRILKFDPDQPRDELGRWTETVSENTDSDQVDVVFLASRKRRELEETCEEQLKSYIFQLQHGMTERMISSSQRKVCRRLRGHLIPPFNY